MENLNAVVDNASAFSTLKSKINDFCKNHLPGGEITKKDRGKIIHDTTWKTNSFEPHEIEIIHTPLFQRLRHINQMGFVDYVYPSARHSRFEHSLGVTVLAGKMFDAASKNSTGKLFGDELRASIRMSALLHDVGHCLFSHTSELVYGTELKKLLQCEFRNGKMPSPHEFFSYLIVTSEEFGLYFEKVKEKYELAFTPQDLANRIVGRAKEDNESNKYGTDFINGPIDADKLDYFHRDSQFSGIPIQLDLDRLLHELKVSTTGQNKQNKAIRELTLSEAGVTCIEQIIFNKMILYSTIYTHHKVEAIDCMFRGVFEYIIEKNIPLNIGGERRPIDTIADFLYLVDYNLFALADETTDTELKSLINNIRNRKLLKRAFAINRKTIAKGIVPIPDIKDIKDILEDRRKLKITDEAGKKEYWEDTEILDRMEKLFPQGETNSWAGLIELIDQKRGKTESSKYLRKLAKQIWEKAKEYGAACSVYEVWIDIPKSPVSDEIQTLMVRPRRSINVNKCEKIENYYPLSQYKDLYEINRLNGHVFAPENCLEQVAKAAKEVLENELTLTFNDLAIVHSKN